MIRSIQETTEFLQKRGFEAPEIGIVLGTGLGKLADEIENPIEAHYNHIPYFPLATVEFHSGKLIYGILEGKKVVVMQGRFHCLSPMLPGPSTPILRQVTSCL